jgi:hypothetical protein
MKDDNLKEKKSQRTDRQRLLSNSLRPYPICPTGVGENSAAEQPIDHAMNQLQLGLVKVFFRPKKIFLCYSSKNSRIETGRVSL